MRAEARQALIAGVPEVQGRVFELHGASVSTPKPFLVLKEAAEQGGDWWGGDYTTTLQVWVYTKRESFNEVDTIARKVIDVLDNASLVTSKGTFLTAYWGMAGPDTPDDEWQALTRALNFRVFSLGWMPPDGLQPGYPPDPIATLVTWTKTVWPVLQTDPLTWAPTNPSPGLFWRIAASKAVPPRNVWGSWINADVRGHILAPSLQLRLAWSRRIIEGLERQRRLTLDDGSDLEVMQGTASFDAALDPFRAGQVRLTLQYGVLEPNIANELGVKFYSLSPARAGGTQTMTTLVDPTTFDVTQRWAELHAPGAPLVPPAPQSVPIYAPSTDPTQPFRVVRPAIPQVVRARVPGDVVVIAAPPPSSLVARVNVSFE